MSAEQNYLQGYTRGTHKGREDLAGEHKFTDIGQLVLLVIFLIVWIVDSFAFQFSTILNEYIPLYVTVPLGGVVLIVGGYFAFAGLRKVFKEVRKEPIVITTGIFKNCRHPVYLGSMFFFIGSSIMTWSILSFGICLLVIVFYEYVATYEEKLLVEQFGQEYKKYQNTVSKWIPGIKMLTRKKEAEN